MAGGTEPSVAADPSQPGVVAVVSENIAWSSEYHGCSRPAVRISRDSGATWGQPLYPWSWQCQDPHAVIAWGPGSRLWAANPVGVVGGVTVSITHSDDMGRTWSEPFVQRFTKPWSGCFPALAVDNWPASPNYGTVYVAYNWLPNDHGPAVSILASRDGSHWIHADMPSGTALPGYPYTWRIGYRVKAAPDGTAVVTFYQSSLKYWSKSDILNQGPWSNIGRLGFAATVVHFDGTTLSADAPGWVVDTDHPAAEWQSGLDIDDSGRAWLAVERSDMIVLVDLLGARREFRITGMKGFKPSLAISGRTIFVGWHARDTKRMIRTYYSLSYDGGETFSPPTLVSGAAWDAGTAAADVVNGVGLRENADFANGIAYYAYGDARSGLSIYVAWVRA